MKDWLNTLIDKVLTFLHLSKYREQLTYLVVGGMTTVVDWIVFTLMVLFVPPLFAPPFENSVPYICAWFAAVLFAFFASKYFVFECDTGKSSAQFFKFLLSRVLTLAISLVGDFILCGELQWNAFWTKAIISVLVIIINYITGKWVVFIKSKRNREKDDGTKA